MPLALELASAWVELLSPEEIVAEITRCLDFLETDQVGVPDRQRSIQAVFESSLKLLSKAERDAFLSLCVFAGSFSRLAAQQVSGASLRMLLALADKSWLQQTDGGHFQLHELMRQYGEDQLKQDSLAWREAKNCHAKYFTDFVTEQSRKMQSPEQVEGVKALAEEIDGNIKIAWDWLVSERRWNDITEYLLLGLFQYGEICYYDELIHWFKSARLSLTVDNTPEGRLAFVIFYTIEVAGEEIRYFKNTNTYEHLRIIWQVVNQYDLAGAMGFWFVILAIKAGTYNLTSGLDERLDASISRLREQRSPWQLAMSLCFRATQMSEFVHDEAGLREAEKIFRDLGVFMEHPPPLCISSDNPC
jgi:hypothetical protein